jgi:hypothetical protein
MTQSMVSKSKLPQIEGKNKKGGNIVSKIFKSLFISNLVIALFLFCSTPSMAENSVPVENPSTIKLGLTYFYYNYKEDLVMPAKSTEYGWLPGVYLDYTFKKKSSIYAKVFLSYAAADITYDGATLSGTPVKFTNESARMLKFEANIGYAIPLGKDILLIPYLGYGHQDWQRGDPNYIDGAFIYQEFYEWNYIPVGIKADYNITEKLNIAASVAANFMFYGTVTSYFSKIPSGYPDMNFTLGNRIGFYTEIPVSYKFTNHIGISVTPWYEYRSFAASNVNSYGFYEPSSTANEYGVNVGVLFSF